MDTIFVDNKLYYINKFDDFLELVRDKIGQDARRWLEETYKEYLYLKELYDSCE